MEFELLSPKRLKVCLSDSELLSYGLKFENLSTADTRARELIDDILSAAEAETGFKREKNQAIYVKALPEADGCTVFFSIIEEKMQKESEPHIYITHDAENALFVTQKLYESDCCAQMYYGNGNYIFIPTDESERHLLILSEYCSRYGSGKALAASVKESFLLLYKTPAEAAGAFLPVNRQ